VKKSLSIEKLLLWAFRDELPKEQATTSFLRPDTFTNPAMAISKVRDLGTTVDEPDVRNRFGMVPDFTAQESPHPDAIAVYHAVRRLSELQLALPDDWNPLTDMGDLGPDGPAAIAAALRRLSITDINGVRHLRDGHAPTYLVPRSAILGPPDWQCEKPVRKTEKLHDGRIRYFVMQNIVTEQGSFEIEVDGFDYGKNRAKPGAYKKTFLDPSPEDAAVARGEYEIWHAALGVLAEELAGRLEDHDVIASDRPARPWEEGERPAPRILVDNTPRQPIAVEPRPVAGPLPDRTPESIREAERQRLAAERQRRAALKGVQAA
jgi:hypothetical protein